MCTCIPVLSSGCGQSRVSATRRHEEDVELASMSVRERQLEGWGEGEGEGGGEERV